MNENIAVIFIDPVFDFIDKEGIFFKKFGSDSIPLIHILSTLQDILNSCFNLQNVKKILCTSRYIRDQFQTIGLEMLCVEEKGQKSCLDPSLFDLHIVKKSNCIYECIDQNQELELEHLLTKCSKILVTGMTTGSCIRASVLELMKRGHHVVIARDGITHRTSQNECAERHLIDWEKSGIEVVQSWKDILR
jgi:hypothetical protein